MSKPSYLALGDSYTIGEGVAKTDSWPQQLAGIMGWQQPKVIARTGWTTKDLLNNIPDTLERYDIGSLLIGVNNQYQDLDLAQFLVEFSSLLTLLKRTTQTAFVITIPNYGYTPFGLNKRQKITSDLISYNKEIKKISQDHDLKVYDIYDLSCKQGTADFLINDLLHPAEGAYKAWAELIAKGI
jgi:lysophospholipase L1-like esterase